MSIFNKLKKIIDNDEQYKVNKGDRLSLLLATSFGSIFVSLFVVCLSRQFNPLLMAGTIVGSICLIFLLRELIKNYNEIKENNLLNKEANNYLDNHDKEIIQYIDNVYKSKGDSLYINFFPELKLSFANKDRDKQIFILGCFLAKINNLISVLDKYSEEDLNKIAQYDIKIEEQEQEKEINYSYTL